MTEIKKILTMRQVAEYYGYKPNRAGFIACPFHQEKTASLKLYEGDKGFSCFGCGTYGSIFDFIMKLFNINYHQALLRLNHDFNLNISNRKPSKKELVSFQLEQHNKQKNKELNNLIEWYLIFEFWISSKKVKMYEPKEKFEELSDEFINALIAKNNTEIWLNER
jgi:DNA primase